MSLINFDPDDLSTPAWHAQWLAPSPLPCAADHQDHFRVVVEQFAQRGTPFTSEDVTDIIGLADSSGSPRNSIVGAMINGCAKGGMIRKTGRMVPSRNTTSHASEIREWIGA